MVASLNKNNFWKGKTVLLTGHTGFKGSWLSMWLKKLGANLIGYSLQPSTEPNLFELIEVSEGMISIEGNIHNFESLKNIFKKYKPEIVIHMAAQSLVSYSYKFPVETYMTNVMGTVNLFEAVRQTGGVKVIVNVTSDKCYENKERMAGYKEDEPMGGHDPYSSSKGCAELVTSAYRRSFFSSSDFSKHNTAIASARAGNVIGGGDWAEDRLIPDIVRGVLAGQKIKIRNPKSMRPWQHVLEPLSGYLTLAEKLWVDGPKYSEAWNFGPDEKEDKPVSYIVENFLKLWGDKAEWEIDKKEENRFHEANYLKLDCSKAKTKLQWIPVWKTDTALEKTAQWYKAFKEKDDLQKLTLSQINQYEQSYLKV